MLPYTIAVRAKPGEFAACGRVERQFQPYLRPRFIVPPLRERDPAHGRALSPDEIAHVLGRRIGKNWPLQAGFVDAQFVADELGDAGKQRLFSVIRTVNPKIDPVFSLGDLDSGFASSVVGSADALALFVEYETDPDDVAAVLRAASIDPRRVTVLLNFHGAPLGVEAGPSIAGAIEGIYAAAPVRQIVFQGSAYPSNLPVGPNESTRIPRGEWHAFRSCREELSLPPGVLAYGDYGADTSKIEFPKSKGGRPRPHLRFTGANDTLVVRGADEGPFTTSMRKVARQVVDSREYVGRGYSYADDRIWQFAHRMTETCGDPTTWRELNTAHHIAVVMRTLGAEQNVRFTTGTFREFEEQGSLF